MAEKIRVTFLGTGGSIPTEERNHSAIFLQYKDESILVDCGEGTQRQFRKAKLNPCRITRLLITHWHGDHVLGIPGLLQTLAFSGYNKTLYVYGPKGTKRFMEEMFRTFAFTGKISVEIEEIENGIFLDEGDFYLEAKRVEHGIPCNAYNFVKKGTSRIDKSKLKKLKLPNIPLLKELKNGKDIVYDGKKYLARNLIFAEEDKKISIIVDTSFNNQLISFAKGADLLICESTFDANLEKIAKRYKHLTVRQTAEVAKKAKITKLYLTHVSQRYDKNLGKILKESRKIFKNSFLARDLDSTSV